MQGRWFSNYGQFLQFVIGLLALLTALNAWSAVRQLDFFAFAPVLFYLAFTAFALVLIVGVRVVPTSATSTPDRQTQSTASPFQEKPIQKELPSLLVHSPLSWAVETATIKAGDFYDGSHIARELRITLKNVVTDAIPLSRFGEEIADLADLECKVGGGLVYGGAHTKEVGTNRYLCPAISDAHRAEPGSIYSFTFTAQYFSFVGVRVDHINMHAKEAVVTVCRVSGFFINP